MYKIYFFNEIEKVELKYKKVYYKHYKSFKFILASKEEMARFLSGFLGVEIENEKLEEQKTAFINEHFKKSESDIIYKIKDTEIYFLIEHQSKVDYRMPFRILKYEMAIVESAIDEKECKRKDYLYPRVNAIVLYTGKQKWNVSKTFNEAQVSSILEKAIKFAKYILVDINNYTEEKITDFKGTYARQLPVKSTTDEIIAMRNDMLENCKVYNYKKKGYIDVYDLSQANGNDRYGVYLSGSTPILTIDNPEYEGTKELIVFKDSFGSSLVPLLVQGYSKITLLDTRYISTKMIGQYVDFTDKDVLFIYNTVVINNSETMK